MQSSTGDQVSYARVVMCSRVLCVDLSRPGYWGTERCESCARLLVVAKCVRLVHLSCTRKSRDQHSFVVVVDLGQHDKTARMRRVEKGGQHQFLSDLWPSASKRERGREDESESGREGAKERRRESTGERRKDSHDMRAG